MCFTQSMWQETCERASTTIANPEDKKVGPLNPHVRLFRVIILCVFFLLGFVLQTQAAERLFHIEGSNTLGAQLVPRWAALYLKDLGATEISMTPGQGENEQRVVGVLDGRELEIYVAAHGSSTGIRALKDARCDLAMSSRRRRASDGTEGWLEHVVALDGLAIIAHPSNVLKQLSLKQVRQLFTGQHATWEQLGGVNTGVQLYARDEKSGTWDTFKSLVLARSGKLHSGAKRFESSDALAAQVQSDPGGIGFVGLSSIGGNAMLAVADADAQAMAPTRLAVATEDYPLARRLYFYSKPATTSENSHVKAFLALVQTAKYQAVVDEIGFVSLNPIETRGLVEGPERYRRLVRNGRRVSINFRFEKGGAELDSRGQRDVQRLADHLRSYEVPPLVQLVGFGDEKNRRERARALSKMRAISVRAALLDGGVTTESVVGFGALSPVAGKAGQVRLKNRRVEVWFFDGAEKDRLDFVKRSFSDDEKSVTAQR